MRSSQGKLDKEKSSEYQMKSTTRRKGESKQFQRIAQDIIHYTKEIGNKSSHLKVEWLNDKRVRIKDIR